MRRLPLAQLESSPRVPDTESERALTALREQALAHGRVDRDGVRPAGAPFPQATAATGYYGVPLLKKPVWTWEVPLYFFVGGAAGASAVIAAVGRWADGDTTLVRDARWIAAVGSHLSAALLTADLGRPERFIYMLRVFKPQSAISMGSWTLAAFTASATGTAAAAFLAGRMNGGGSSLRAVAGTTGTVSAAAGTVMCTYTGVLIGATVIPVWNENVSLLPLHFGASGVASAVGMLELTGHDSPVLNDLGAAAAAVETVVGAWIEARETPGLQPLRTGASGWLTRAGGVLSGPVPLLCRMLGRRSPGWRRAATVSALAGSLLTRWGWVMAGRASASFSSSGPA
jgi:hypothetical protein